MSARSLLFFLRLKSICMRRVLRCMLSGRVVPRFAVPFGRAVCHVNLLHGLICSEDQTVLSRLAASFSG